jgi:hypothetical protein
MLKAYDELAGKFVADAVLPGEAPETWEPLTDPDKRALYGIQPDDMTPYQVNRSTNKLAPAGRSGGDTFNIGNATDTQYNAALYADRMAAANNILTSFELVKDPQTGEMTPVPPPGTDPAQVAKGSVPFLGNFFVSPEYRKVQQAQIDFATAVLRRESGAAISASEFEKVALQYFPQPGDDAALIAQKRESRQRQIDGIRQASGPLNRASGSTDWTQVTTQGGAARVRQVSP